MKLKGVDLSLPDFERTRDKVALQRVLREKTPDEAKLVLQSLKQTLLDEEQVSSSHWRQFSGALRTVSRETKEPVNQELLEQVQLRFAKSVTKKQIKSKEINIRNPEQKKDVLELIDLATTVNELNFIKQAIMEADRLVPGYGISTKEGSYFLEAAERFRSKWATHPFDEDLVKFVREKVDHKLALEAAREMLESKKIKFNDDAQGEAFAKLIEEARSAGEIDAFIDALEAVGKLGKQKSVSHREGELFFGAIAKFREKWPKHEFDKDLAPIAEELVTFTKARDRLLEKIKQADLRFKNDEQARAFEDIVEGANETKTIEGIAKAIDTVSELGVRHMGGAFIDAVDQFRLEWPKHVIDHDIETKARDVVQFRQERDLLLNKCGIRFKDTDQKAAFNEIINGVVNRREKYNVLNETIRGLSETLDIIAELGERRMAWGFFKAVDRFRLEWPKNAIDHDIATKAREVVDHRLALDEVKKQMRRGQIDFAHSSHKEGFKKLLGETTFKDEVDWISRALTKIAALGGKKSKVSPTEGSMFFKAVNWCRESSELQHLSTFVDTVVKHRAAIDGVRAQLKSKEVNLRSSDRERELLRILREDTLYAEEIGFVMRALKAAETVKGYGVNKTEWSIFTEAVAWHRNRYGTHAFDGDLVGKVDELVREHKTQSEAAAAN
ncbi:hypothetical protein ACFL6C_04765 [Myxococcota bacterium]